MPMETTTNATPKSPTENLSIEKAEAVLENGVVPKQPEEPIDFDSQLKDLRTQSDTATSILAEKMSAYADWKTKMDSIRESLGMPSTDETYPSQNSIDEVKTEIERLKQEKETAVEGKDMNDLLNKLSTFSSSEINIIIATGKTPEDKEIQDKGAKKVKPGIMMQLLDMAYSGAKALTMSGLQKIAGGMQKVGTGIYVSAKKE